LIVSLSSVNTRSPAFARNSATESCGAVVTFERARFRAGTAVIEVGRVDGGRLRAMGTSSNESRLAGGGLRRASAPSRLTRFADCMTCCCISWSVGRERAGKYWTSSFGSGRFSSDSFSSFATGRFSTFGRTSVRGRWHIEHARWLCLLAKVHVAHIHLVRASQVDVVRSCSAAVVLARGFGRCFADGCGCFIAGGRR